MYIVSQSVILKTISMSQCERRKYLFNSVNLPPLHLMPGDAPLTAVQLLWVNMIMDTLGALALATEPPDDNLMKKAPVGRTGKFITNVMWRNIVGQSIFQFTVIWYLQTQGTYLFGLEGSEANTVLNTIIFNTFVFCQVNQPLKILTFLT